MAIEEEQNLLSNDRSKRSGTEQLVEDLELTLMRRHFNHFEPSIEEQKKWRRENSPDLLRIYGELLRDSDPDTIRQFGLDSFAETIESEMNKRTKNPFTATESSEK